MAHNLYLELTVNGVRVEGEPAAPPLGRENDIECVFFESSVALALAAGSTVATGRRRHGPIVIRKRIDKSTPLLTKALTDTALVTAVFRLFRPDAQGQSEHFYTVEIREARIASVKQVNPETFNPTTSDFPEIEEVSFIFEHIFWKYENPPVESEDTIGTET
jgi:type VI secretion system secreted protein Hcp